MKRVLAVKWLFRQHSMQLDEVRWPVAEHEVRTKPNALQWNELTFCVSFDLWVALRLERKAVVDVAVFVVLVLQQQI